MIRVIGIIASLLSFLILIMSHEFGHYSVAKFLGIKVNEFSVGMGPKLWQKKGKETLYSVRAIPIGGYCMLEGEEDASDDPRAFSAQPWWSKILVLVAGSFNNIVLGILMFTLIFCYIGTPSTTLAAVDETGPAYEAGIRAGDRIVKIDEETIKNFAHAQNLIGNSKDGELDIVVIRDGENKSFTVKTVTNENGAKIIGINARVEHSFIACLKQGILETGRIAVEIIGFFRNLFRGNASLGDVTGVIGVVAIASESIRYGFINFIYLMAMFTANLGYMNLLPIPALDGGRILMVILRAISGGRISDRAEQIVNAVGMILLLLLMAILIFKDAIGLIFR